METTIAEIRPEVEFPLQDEPIVSPQYTFRIGVPASAAVVDVSIDQGPWLACRNVAGYWWYDWSGYEDGEHEIIARARGESGRWRLSTPHEFIVARI
jgi:hypothetical protein